MVTVEANFLLHPSSATNLIIYLFFNHQKKSSLYFSTVPLPPIPRTQGNMVGLCCLLFPPALSFPNSNSPD